MAKKLKPENIEQLAALISIMRPGCISGDTKVFINQYEHSCDGKMRFKKYCGHITGNKSPEG
jgi:DNA polymerase III alpha subunit